jgi:hypothetical protein
MKRNSLENCSRLRWLGASGGLDQGHLFQLKKWGFTGQFRQSCPTFGNREQVSNLIAS